MKKTTFSIPMQLLTLLLMAFGCVLPTFAAGNPDLTALYGRYRLSGTCTLTDAIVPAETGYDVVLLPGDNDNEVKIQGLFGYCGPSVFVYNQEEGTLGNPATDEGEYMAYLCAEMFTGYMAVQANPVNLAVTDNGNGLTLSTNEALYVSVADPDNEDAPEGGMAAYMEGFTLTKVTSNKTLSDVIGTYTFSSPRVDFPLVEEASENFTLTVQQKEGSENTLLLSGWFGLEGATVEGEFMPESGVIVLPESAPLANGMYFGYSPTSVEELGMPNFNGQPFFLVEEGQLTTPSYFNLDNGFDMEMEMPLMFAFRAGTAVKENGNSYPDLTALYGRYRLSGTCTLTDAIVPAETGYDVVLLPGDNDNEVKIQGLFGYCGPSVFVYNQEEGTLGNPATDEGEYMAYLCAEMFTGYMAVQANPVNLAVTDNGNGLTLSTNEALYVSVADPDNEDAPEGGMAAYMEGFTLTKVTSNKTLSDVIGTYTFSSPRVDFPLVEEASENFTLTVQQKEGSENTLLLSGWFGLEGATVEGEFMPESGVIVLPESAPLANGMYFGYSPTSVEELGMPNFNGQPFFLVEEGQLTTPSYFNLDNGFDMEMEMPLMFAFRSGTAVKENGNSIQTATSEHAKVTATAGALHIEATAATDIIVYNLQGATVSSTHAAHASVNGLPAGLYVVKVGDHSVKVIVK